MVADDDSNSKISLLTPLGYQFSPCGYCKGADGSPSYYCHGYRCMHPHNYELLANRMWRRSGTTYYKPDTKNACCPHYTIRLDAYHFKVARNQKKVSNRFTSFIIGDEYHRKAARLFPKSKSEKKTRKGAFDVCERIKEPEWDHLPKQQGETKSKAVLPAHRLQVTLESDAFTEEKFVLFEQYQRLIHKEPPSKISKSIFRSFLCSGLSRSTYSEGGKSRPIGSYHQCYRIDGKLVAIGVLDLLPHCVSSVYLIYHVDFAQWEFGKLSALREIAMAIEYGYRYYYMGYYIHSCTKMRYKRTFKPTYVLDPESYEWMLFDDELLTRFENRKYVSLAREHRLGLGATDADPEEVADRAAAKASTRKSTSVFKSGMTGLISPATIIDTVELPELPFYYQGDLITVPSLSWNEPEMNESHSLIGRFAEFIACVGVENLGHFTGSGLLPALDWIKENEEADDA